MSNVLVYSGPGVSASSLSHTLRTLRRLLPSYDVQCINAQSLALDPWMESTSLLVLPGGRDLPYVEKFGEGHHIAIVGGQTGGSSRMARADARIREFVVDHGGAFLGICAGAYYASGMCDFERGDAIMEVVGNRPALRFFPGTCRGTVYPGFVYESDKGARLVSLDCGHDVPSSRVWTTYYNGGGAFIDAEVYAANGIEVLARYMTDAEAEQRGAASGSESHRIKQGFAGQAAAILCYSGHGKALLYGTHPEFPATATAQAAQQSGAPETIQGTASSFDELEAARLAVFGSHLQRLGLRVEALHLEETEQQTKLTPLILASRNQPALAQVLANLQAVGITEGENAQLNEATQEGKILTISDSNDTLHFYHETASEALFRACKRANYTPYNAPVTTPNNADAARAGQSAEVEMEVDLHRVPKYVLVADSGMSYESYTPHWSSTAFFRHADASREAIAANSSDHEWATGQRNGDMFASSFAQTSERFADVLTYTQVVTSTQTMLDKNYKLLTRLPSGLTSFATHQVSGRGRGKNAWISPLGCLQFSLLLRLPQPQQMLWHAGVSSIVFVQYLAGLAIVESVRCGALGPGYAKAIGSKIRIKWPNDVYAEVEDVTNAANSSATSRKGTFIWRGKRYAKMAGVLVNSQFAGSELALVVGCGINTLNPRPTTSLSDLIDAHNASRPQGENALPVVTQERFAGAILATLERMWSTFIQAGGNFTPFVDAYRRAWLHSDQDTLLTDTVPPTRARIVGITTDHGLLRCVPLLGSGTSLPDTDSPGSWGLSGSGKGQSAAFIDLQPDGNSFDMLQNLIRRKE